MVLGYEEGEPVEGAPSANLEVLEFLKHIEDSHQYKADMYQTHDIMHFNYMGHEVDAEVVGVGTSTVVINFKHFKTGGDNPSIQKLNQVLPNLAFRRIFFTDTSTAMLFHFHQLAQVRFFDENNVQILDVNFWRSDHNTVLIAQPFLKKEYLLETYFERIISAEKQRQELKNLENVRLPSPEYPDDERSSSPGATGSGDDTIEVLGKRMNVDVFLSEVTLRIIESVKALDDINQKNQGENIDGTGFQKNMEGFLDAKYPNYSIERDPVSGDLVLRYFDLFPAHLLLFNKSPTDSNGHTHFETYDKHYQSDDGVDELVVDGMVGSYKKKYADYSKPVNMLKKLAASAIDLIFQDDSYFTTRDILVAKKDGYKYKLIEKVVANIKISAAVRFLPGADDINLEQAINYWLARTEKNMILRLGLDFIDFIGQMTELERSENSQALSASADEKAIMAWGRKLFSGPLAHYADSARSKTLTADGAVGIFRGIVHTYTRSQGHYKNEVPQAFLKPKTDAQRVQPVKVEREESEASEASDGSEAGNELLSGRYSSKRSPVIFTHPPAVLLTPDMHQYYHSGFIAGQLASPSGIPLRQSTPRGTLKRPAEVSGVNGQRSQAGSFGSRSKMQRPWPENLRGSTLVPPHWPLIKLAKELNNYASPGIITRGQGVLLTKGLFAVKDLNPSNLQVIWQRGSYRQSSAKVVSFIQKTPKAGIGGDSTGRISRTASQIVRRSETVQGKPLNDALGGVWPELSKRGEVPTSEDAPSINGISPKDSADIMRLVDPLYLQKTVVSTAKSPQTDALRNVLVEEALLQSLVLTYDLDIYIEDVSTPFTLYLLQGYRLWAGLWAALYKPVPRSEVVSKIKKKSNKISWIWLQRQGQGDNTLWHVDSFIIQKHSSRAVKHQSAEPPPFIYPAALTEALAAPVPARAPTITKPLTNVRVPVSVANQVPALRHTPEPVQLGFNGTTSSAISDRIAGSSMSTPYGTSPWLYNPRDASSLRLSPVPVVSSAVELFPPSLYSLGHEQGRGMQSPFQPIPGAMLHHPKQ